MSVSTNGKFSKDIRLITPELKLTNGFEDSSDKDSPSGEPGLRSSHNGESGSNNDLVKSSSPVISALCIDTNDSEHSPLSGVGVSV